MCISDSEKTEENQEERESLRNADLCSCDVERISPQTFNKETRCSVKHKICACRLKSVCALLPDIKKNEEDDEISDRFIKERRVNRRQSYQLGAESCEIGSGGFTPHTPGHRCRGSECFLIEEVAPAADCLAQRQIYDAVICKRRERDLTDLTHYQKAKETCDDAAVYGKAACPCIENALNVACISAPVEDNVVRTCADYRTGYGNEHCVVNECIREIVLFRLLKCKNDAQDQSQSDQDPVPVDLEIADLKSDRINVELYSEARKLHFFMIDKIHIALPCVKGLE